MQTKKSVFTVNHDERQKRTGVSRTMNNINLNNVMRFNLNENIINY